MSQGSTILPTSGVVSGPAMASDMNAALDALRTAFSGASAPSADAPEEGQYWIDTSNALPVVNQYTGGAWVPIYVLDNVNNIVLPASGPFPTTTGTSSAYALATTPYAPTALKNGLKVSFLVHTANAGACTLNWNGLGAHPLRSASGADLNTNALVANSVVEATYLSATTEFVLSGFFAGSAPVPPGVSMEFAGFVAPSGYLMENGQAISRSSFVALFAAITLLQTGTFTIGTKTITGLADTSNMKFGTPLESSNLSAGTTVTGVLSSSSVTVSSNAIASGSFSARFFPWGGGDGSTTFNVPSHRGRIAIGSDTMTTTAANNSQVTYSATTTSGSANLAVGSLVGICVGQRVIGTGIPGGATVTAITGVSTVTISANATASGVVSVRFSSIDDAQAVGGLGGSAFHVQLIGEVGPHAHAFSGTTGNDSPDHVHQFATIQNAPGTTISSAGGNVDLPGINPNTNPPNTKHQHPFSGTTDANIATTLPMPILPPVIVKNFIIKT